MALIQPEASGKIRDSRAKHYSREQVGATGYKFALQIPAVNSTVAAVAGTGDNVVVVLFLERDEFGDEFRLLRGNHLTSATAMCNR